MRSAFSSNTASLTHLEEPSELSQAVIFSSLFSSLLGISVLKSLKDIDYLLYHCRVLLLFVLIATVCCQFSDKKRECCWGSIYNMSWRMSADFFELKTGRLAAKTQGGGWSSGRCVCTHAHTHSTHLASKSKWMKRKEIQIQGKRGNARSIIETPYKFGEKKIRKEGMRGEGKNSER